jgi:hypothetical protein
MHWSCCICCHVSAAKSSGPYTSRVTSAADCQSWQSYCTASTFLSVTCTTHNAQQCTAKLC